MFNWYVCNSYTSKFATRIIKVVQALHSPALCSYIPKSLKLSLGNI